MIRAIPSNASDNIYCTLLAQNAVHGAMAGYTGFTVGVVNGRHTYIPFHVSSVIIFLYFNVLHSTWFYWYYF
jgi:6-phosphofructokinase